MIDQFLQPLKGNQRKHIAKQLIRSSDRPEDLARKEYVSQYTIKNHASEIYKQMGVCSRTELQAKYIRFIEGE